LQQIAGNSSKKNNTNKEKQRGFLFYKKSMYVVKRDTKEPVDKITDRIKKLCYGLNDWLMLR
jgi:hypothetical protein